jgi:hypothetical protein
MKLWRKVATFSAVMLAAMLPFASGQDTPIIRDVPRPQRFTVEDLQNSGTGLPTWSGSFTYSGTTYTYVMVGTDPSQGSVTTSVPVYIIPLTLTFSDGTVFDASGPLYHKTISATQAIMKSPIFQSVDWVTGTVDLGSTQYIDAFQRGNFWSSVSTISPDYHVLLARPTVLPTQAYTVPANQGHTIPGPLPGTKRAILNQSFIDGQITGSLFAKFTQITPAAFTIFLTYNVFPGGAYGYHDVFGSSPLTGKTYSYVSYLDPYTQLIDADISTLAHEVGEWMDDAYINNNTPCGILEVGDPLNSAIFNVTLNGRVWHPQDLAFIGYFSYDPSQSVNQWMTFRNTYNQSCENGPSPIR